MILFKWNETELKSIQCKHPQKHREVIDVSYYKGVGLYWGSQSFNREEARWKYSHIKLCISVTRFWSWGTDHGWYDGPRCSLSLGFLHFYWEGNWKTGRCLKCEESSNQRLT